MHVPQLPREGYTPPVSYCCGVRCGGRYTPPGEASPAAAAAPRGYIPPNLESLLLLLLRLLKKLW